MIDMICDNCGAKIDASEEYCPNCGMQLLDLPPAPIKKKRNYKNSNHYSRNDSRSFEKPIKKRHIKNSSPESPDYSQYTDEYDEEELSEETYYEQNYYKKDYKEKSNMGMGSMLLFLLLALILGLVVGMIIFGPQTIPSLPGFNT